MADWGILAPKQDSILSNTFTCHLLGDPGICMYEGCLESFKTVSVSQNHLYALQ